MGKLRDWYVSRTGYPELFRTALYEHIPGGSRFRYATGSMLVFSFVTMVITGMFLWMGYSPSSQTAWESVYFIQYEMNGGWLLRGIHHFMAQAMMVLLPLHLLQVVIDKAYQAPREFNFWTGMFAMLLILGLALTGYLLPWDQKGFWATGVATNLMALSPGMGDELQTVVVGGDEYGHHTLTRFFALHAGILPTLLVIVLVKHLYFFRRHGIKPHKPESGRDEYFWPKQVLKDSIGCAVLLAIVLGFCIHWDLYGLVTGDMPREHYGAELFAPADPSEPYSAARPEWYFLALFQMLKSFTGSNDYNTEFMGAIVLPGVIVGVMLLMPIIGRVRIGHYFNVAFLFFLLAGAGYFTYRALEDDLYARWYGDREERMLEAASSEEERGEIVKKFKTSRDYLAAVEAAEHEAERVKELVYLRRGAPKEGAIALVRSDPLIQGPKLFAKHCASCHSYLEPAEFAAISEEKRAELPYSAPNLYRVGSREWIGGLLDPERIASVEYFGHTTHVDGQMVDFVAGSLAELDDDEREQLRKLVIALSAEAELPYQEGDDKLADEQGLLEEGRTAMSDLGCFDCHVMGDEGYEGSAPDLTGYMSADWLRLMISNPEHERMYGYGGESHNDRMPAFHDADDPGGSQLTAEDVELLVRWLRGDTEPRQ